MENLIWVIYLIDVLCGDLEGLGFLVGTTFVLSLMGYLICNLVFYDDDGFPEPLRKFRFGRVVVGCLTLMFLSNFIPSQDTAYKMLAVYGVSEVAKNENVQELMGEGLDVLKLTLRDYKEKLEDKGNKND